jgi:hypothetical protein
MKAGVIIALAVCLGGCGAEGEDGTANDTAENSAQLGRPTIHEVPGPHHGAGDCSNFYFTNPMVNHGGHTISGTFNIYYIWYGNWSNNSAKTILADLATNIGGTPYYNINTSYGVSNSVSYRGSAIDNYSQGTSLSDSAVFSVVTSALSAGRLPTDTNGLYYVLTSADVTQSGSSGAFCTSYCGWHNHGSWNGHDIKFSFIGNPDYCVAHGTGGCYCDNTTVSPNGNPAADGMATLISHEMEETHTDPDLNAWYDSGGEENADKCAWHFGALQTLPNGAVYNVTWGTRHFLVQENWLNVPSGCSDYTCCHISY